MTSHVPVILYSTVHTFVNTLNQISCSKIVKFCFIQSVTSSVTRFLLLNATNLCTILERKIVLVTDLIKPENPLLYFALTFIAHAYLIRLEEVITDQRIEVKRKNHDFLLTFMDEPERDSVSS